METAMAIATESWNVARLRKERIDRLQQEMHRQSIGAMYLSDVNLQYAVCLKIPGAAVFVPAAGEAIVLVRPRDEGWVRRQGVKVARVLYDRGSTWEPEGKRKLGEFGNGIAELMREHGVGG